MDHRLRRPPDRRRPPTLEVTDTGQIVVDATMRSVSHPDVYAVGDAAFAMGPGDKPLRMSCASGTPMAWQAADAIAARLTGGKLPNVPLRYFNQCISLGRKDGMIQYVTADDRAVRAALTGRLAARLQGARLQGRGLGRRQPDARDADPAPPRRAGAGHGGLGRQGAGLVHAAKRAPSMRGRPLRCRSRRRRSPGGGPRPGAPRRRRRR